MVKKTLFGTTQKGETVYKYTISTNIASASVITFGATLQAFIVPSKNGNVDIVLGYDDVLSYETKGNYIGATVGRNANRIKNGEFILNGEKFILNKNNGVNNLHGGNVGFSHRVWEEKEIDSENNSVTLSIFSKDGEEGFPGNLTASVKYTLTESSLDIEYFASSDKDTVCNFTNHSYFNLDGAGSETFNDCLLKIDGEYILEVDSTLIPTGKLLNVKNTPYDFTNLSNVKLGNEKVKCFDVCYALKNNGNYEQVACAYSNSSGVKMTVLTDQPAVQLYGGAMRERVGKGEKVYKSLDSFCLETQGYIDAINQPSFPPIVLKKGGTYYSKTTFKCEL